ILRAGGNAIDAAIAASLMACVAEPVLASPGGGGFAMARQGETGTVKLYDFFTQTPLEKGNGQAGIRKIHANFGNATQAFHIGPGTSATPGFLRGLETLANEYGRLNMPALTTPAVGRARTGIKVTPYQHYLSTVVEPILTASPKAAALFCPQGVPPSAGEIFANPDLADTLESFGAGEIDAIENAMICGHLSQKDFDHYRVEQRTPLSVRIANATVHLNPAPAASGQLIAHAFKAIAGHNTEAVAAALNDADQNRSALLGLPASYRGTTHISVIDREGNACAITVSNGEGNGELVPDMGFMVNNMLGEEDVNPYPPGEWPCKKRMSSMMCPTLVEYDDGRIISLGSGGSNRIRSAIFHVLVRILIKNFPLEKAVRAPRLHIEKGHLDFEGFFKQPAIDALAANYSDHRVWPEANMFFGGVHAVERDAGHIFSGHGDARRDGYSILVR
ncbi:MAG: gamma-glutamyltransferase, partial [Hyphomicrobiales bacterium]